MSRLQNALEALKAERSALQDDLAWLDEQIASFEARVNQPGSAGESPSAAAPRESTSPRPRGTAAKDAGRSRARTGGRPKASANGMSGGAPDSAADDTKVRIVALLRERPQSTAADVAKAIGETRPAIAKTLVELARSGDIVKTSRGYSVE